MKELLFFAVAKLDGHRCKISSLHKKLGIHSHTCRRRVNAIVKEGWCGCDGKFLFPRSWRNLELAKRGGLYLTSVPKNQNKFEAMCFAKALRAVYRKQGSQHPRKRRVLQDDFPARYLSKSLGISQRRFERLKADAQRYRFISVKPQVTIIGTAKDFPSLKKNLHGIPMFKKGKHTVVPHVSKIRILI